MASSFGQVYRANVAAVSGFFARRCSDPQTVADLTSETFVRALGSYRRFDPRRGTQRAWLIGISHNVFRRHVGAVTEARETIQRLSSQLELSQDDIDELAARIDAQSAGRGLLERVAGFPEPERVALELVDVMQMSPKEAAQVVGVSAGALRVRLFRARTRLRKEGIDGI
ncbi:MAG TPA: sigma-70 family RNA polymerase sigma factor [Solirubrobacteraceae bacterium]|nr:sigma-70 family RNA polymerase sigma factor [Solirubrobacteraceae bacterium]